MSENEYKKVWLRNTSGKPFRYNDIIIDTTGSVLMHEDELVGLSHHIHEGCIEIIGIEQITIPTIVKKKNKKGDN